MKLRLKFALQITFMACLLVVSSCGKKNKIKSNLNNGSSPFYVGNPSLSANPQMITQVQGLKSSTQCKKGPRLTNDVSFYVSGGAVSGTRIAGNWQAGFMNNGSISNLYIGVGYFGDLLFITKVTNGGQVIGYNATMSFCSLPNSGGNNFPPLIANERPLVNFQAPSGIVLDVNSYCGFGVVDSASNTSVISQANGSAYGNGSNVYGGGVYGGGVYSGGSYGSTDFRVITSFTKPKCNGQW